MKPFPTLDLAQLHGQYTALPIASRTALEAAYKAAKDSLNASGLETWGDDRAEELLAALTHYYNRCGNAKPAKPATTAAVETGPLRMAE